MTEEQSQGRKVEMPAEVLRIIGVKHLTKNKSAMAYNSALLRLEHLYKTEGLDYIKKHRQELIDGLVELEGF